MTKKITKNKNKKYIAFYIYKISDSFTNIWYIGWTNDYIRRIKQHKSRFFNKHDKEYNKELYIKIRENNIIFNNLDVEILEIIFNVNKKQANLRERDYIFKEKKYNIINTNIII